MRVRIDCVHIYGLLWLRLYVSPLLKAHLKDCMYGFISDMRIYDNLSY